MPLSPEDLCVDIFGINDPVVRNSALAELTPTQRARRKRILDATVEVAATGGYSLVHVRTIADRAKVSLTTVYHYFPSKVHLLVSALSDELTAFDQHVLHELDVTVGALDRLRLAVGSLIAEMEKSDRITDALTHAYVASCVVATDHAQTIREQTSSMFEGVMNSDSSAPNYRPVADILADVWTSEMLALVQDRRTFTDLRHRMFAAIDLLDRGCSIRHQFEPPAAGP